MNEAIESQEPVSRRPVTNVAARELEEKQALLSAEIEARFAAGYFISLELIAQMFSIVTASLKSMNAEETLVFLRIVQTEIKDLTHIKAAGVATVGFISLGVITGIAGAIMTSQGYVNAGVGAQAVSAGAHGAQGFTNTVESNQRAQDQGFLQLDQQKFQHARQVANELLQTERKAEEIRKAAVDQKFNATSAIAN